MKIVHVINYFQHQLGYQEYFLAREQAKAGHDVAVITSNKYFPYPDYEKTAKPILGERVFHPREEDIEGFKVIRLKGIFEQPGRRIWLLGLFEKLREIRPDLVICHGEYTYYTLSLAFIRKLLKFKLVVDCHALYTELSKDKAGVFSKIVKYIFRTFVWSDRSIAWIAVADQCRNLMVNEYGFEGNIPVVPLGSDVHRFMPDFKTRSKMRNNLGVKDGEILIIYTGKLVYSKDPALILEACEELFEKYQLKILFVGDLAESYEGRFNVLKSRMNDRVIHIGAVSNSQIHQYYQAADIAVWPKEASMSSVDAMSCGLPIIVSNYLTERLKNNNGIGIKESNIADLRNAIEKLSSDAELRVSMGMQGRKLVEMELSWEKIAKKFVEIASE